MRNVIWLLVGLGALAFVLAVAAALLGRPVFLVSAEGFSRACTNLVLIAIALKLLGDK